MDRTQSTASLRDQSKRSKALTRTTTSTERVSHDMRFSRSVSSDVLSNPNQDQQNHASQHKSCTELDGVSERVKLEVDKKLVSSNFSSTFRKGNLSQDKFEKALEKAYLEVEKAEFEVPQYERLRKIQRDLQRKTNHSIPVIAKIMNLHLSEYKDDVQKKKKVYNLMIDREISQASENARQSL